MIKKIFSLLIALFVLNTSFLPTLAITDADYKNNIVIDTSFVSDFNINNSKKNQIVQFLSVNDYTDKNGIKIPKNTLFNGKIKSMKKGRFGFRRAKAQIAIHEMVLPDGTKYELLGRTKRKVLKGSAIGNTLKGITLTPVALAFGVAGSAVIIVEVVSIIGILLVPATAMGVGGIMGKLVKGVNYKRNEGDIIQLQVKLISNNEYPKKPILINDFVKDDSTQLNNQIDKEDNKVIEKEQNYNDNEQQILEQKSSIYNDLNPLLKQ